MHPSRRYLEAAAAAEEEEEAAAAAERDGKKGKKPSKKEEKKEEREEKKGKTQKKVRTFDTGEGLGMWLERECPEHPCLARSRSKENA